MRSQGTSRSGSLSCWIAAAGIVAATALAYSNSFAGDFVFDDITEIEENPLFKRGVGWWAASFNGASLPARPVPYATFYANYLLHGTDVWGYHLVNLVIHSANALLLLDIVRRTLPRVSAERYPPPTALAIAFAAALLWAVHPLQTQAVTYIYQRMESLMGLFLLLTLWAFERSIDSRRAGLWQAGSVFACALGMGSKEVMVVAPFVVLAYDFVFVSRAPVLGTLGNRYAYYLALFATEAVLVSLVASESYGEFAGQEDFAVASMKHSAWEHLRSEPGVILWYLRLAVWPWPQNMDYGWQVVDSVREYGVPLLLYGGGLAWSLVASFRRRPLGFLGLAFLTVLAPTSSVMPVIALAFEHRMYLPLAPVAVALAVAAAYAAFAPTSESRGGRWLYLSGALALATVLGVLTYNRNAMYADKIPLWEDSVSKAPDNWEGRLRLATYLLKADRFEQALGHLRAIDPAYDSAGIHLSVGYGLMRLGRVEEAVREFERSVEMDPSTYESHKYLGMIKRKTDPAAATRHCRAALACVPERHFPAACTNLGIALKETDPDEATRLFELALEADPKHAMAHLNLGNQHLRKDRIDEAIACYRRALAVEPGFQAAQNNLEVALEAQRAAAGP